jgi:hypothetical protein
MDFEKEKKKRKIVNYADIGRKEMSVPRNQKSRNGMGRELSPP